MDQPMGGELGEDLKIAQNIAADKMVASVPKVNPGDTIGDVKALLSKKAGEFETIDYVYIVDREGILKGVITVKEVFRNQNLLMAVDEIMKTGLVTIHPTTHQERASYLALSHGIKSVPVVDKDRKLLGVVPYDEILRIFNHEVHADSLQFGGVFRRIGKDITTADSSISHMVKSRIPWLAIGIIGGAVAAFIVGEFESVLSRLLVLAAFMPVLVYLSDAVGTQSEALIIRSLAVNPNLAAKEYLIKEVKISLAIGVFCGVFLGLVGIIGWRNPILGLIIGFSMFLSILASVLCSTALPLLFRRFGLDPAVATGPLATLMSDLLTLTIYFSVAMLCLGVFG
jgi:magnesium transporter